MKELPDSYNSLITGCLAMALAALLTVADSVSGQSSPGKLDIGFDPTAVATSFDSDHLGRIVVQPDQKILIADTLYDTLGLGATPLFRLTDNGTQQPGFSPVGYGFSGIDRSGRIFSMATNRASLVRLFSDGTIDPNFEPVPSISLPLVAELSDGRIMAVVAQQVNPRDQEIILERLSPNGVVDPGFVIQIATGYLIADQVTALVVTPDGGVVLGGGLGFHAFDSKGQENLLVKGLGGAAMWALALQPDGKLLVGGDVGSHGSLFRLNADFSLDTGFAPHIDPDPVATVYSIAVETSGKIIIGGYFQSIEGKPRSCIARLNGDGSLDESFDPGAGAVRPFGPSNLAQVFSTAIQADGKILIGGDFVSVDGVTRGRLARLFGGELPGAPKVQMQPSDHLLVWGAPLTLQAAFSGSPPPVYQWLFNGAAVLGATNSSISIAAVDFSRAGDYQLVASNSFGTVASAVAEISVLTPVSNPVVGNGVFQAIVETQTNRTYAAEFTDSLETPVWSSLTNFSGNGSARVFKDTLSPKTQRFYRVRVW